MWRQEPDRLCVRNVMQSDLTRTIANNNPQTIPKKTAMLLPPIVNRWQQSQSTRSFTDNSWAVRDTMLDIFRGLKTLVKLSTVHTDSLVFRLHYSITVLLLVSFSLIVTTRQYVGNPIDCIHTKDIPEDVLNTYCWIHSTYSVKSAFKKKVGTEVAYPGVDTSKDPKDKKVYKYYQWVCFCLFFQVSIIYNFLNGVCLYRKIF